MTKMKIGGDAHRLYEALKALCEAGESDAYLDLAESLAEIHGERSRAACDELVRAGYITMHATYVTINQ
ncbi:hypothetical protein [Paraburkholderia dipogonis]|uniref:hypothetical protein n=1 Tax=Paraburkholderia dipogonis TaxID=1211383 RepID=UPI0038BCF11D